MKYTIISRDELIKLIKFGAIYQGINYIFDEKNRDLKIEELLKAFPYDDELGFVIVSFTYEKISSFDSIQTLMKLDIKGIINIFCLSNHALDFYKTKFNTNIKFKLYENLKLIEDINKYKVIEDKKKGVIALAEIFELELNNNQDIQELLDYKEANYLEQDFISFYHDMFCYERKNSFFKEDVGYLSDVTALNKMQDIRPNKEIFLSGNFNIKLGNPSDKDKKLKEVVDNTLKKLQDKENQDELMKKILIGTIFLKSKSLLDTEKREKHYWDEFLNLINEFKNDYPEETKIALWYIGVFLGYKYLYDDYYKQLDFKIFKDDNLSEIEASVIEEANPLEKEKNELSHLEDINQQNNEVISENMEIPLTNVNSSQLESINQLEKQKIELEEKLKIKTDELEKQKTTLEDLSKEVQLLKSKEETQSDNIEKVDEVTFELNNNHQIKTTNELIENKITVNDNEEGRSNIVDYQFTDEEIEIFSRKHLQDIAKIRGVEHPTSKKKYPNNKALYKAIKSAQKLVD